LSTTHIFAGELVKVPIPSRHKYWGRLTVEGYYQLLCLKDFLTAGPLSLNANLESIPTGVGLDIDALRTLQTAKDSLVAGWTEHLQFSLPDTNFHQLRTIRSLALIKLSVKHQLQY
jgi:hypothetical protein